jgi:hypothetical protein
LVDIDTQLGLFCAVQVDAVNTTTTTKRATLIFDSFEGPNRYLDSSYVIMYLPPRSGDSNDPYSTLPPEGGFAESILRKVGCGYIYSWQLNTDTSMVH